MSLTDTAIKAVKPKEKDFKLADEKGLYLFVKATGRKYFRFDYRFANKRYTMSFGVYPDVSLKMARERRDEARRLIANGIDPMADKKASKQQKAEEAANTFLAVATEWHASLKDRWSSVHADRKWHYLEKDVYPVIGNMPIKEITAKQLLDLLRKITGRGAIDVAHRVKGLCGEVFRFGIQTGKCEHNPAQDLTGVLPPKRNKHMATITQPEKVGELLRAIDVFRGSLSTRCALRMAPYVMLRPGEIRHAEWSEVDFSRRQLKIPADKMKMGREHIVPLSTQVLAILKELKPVTGDGRYIFPSHLGKDRPLSENTLNGALRRLGFSKDEMTSHGFRGMASTLLHEKGYQSDHIEMQLAHAERNKVKAAYNHAEYLPERTKMMQEWADYLDELRNAVPTRQGIQA